MYKAVDYDLSSALAESWFLPTERNSCYCVMFGILGNFKSICKF